jgi:hypothetical protein
MSTNDKNIERRIRIVRVPEQTAYELEIRPRGDVMKPNPQEKCMIIRTSGSRTRSDQLLPIRSEASFTVSKYEIGTTKKNGEITSERIREAKFRSKFIGAAR